MEKLLKNAASAEQVITVLTERLASLQRAFGKFKIYFNVSWIFDCQVFELK